MAARLAFVALLVLVVGAVLVTERRARAQTVIFAEQVSGPSPHEMGCVRSLDNSCGVDSNVVSAALRSPDTLWAFLTSPESRFRERRAAAMDGAAIVPLDWLVRIDAANRELAAADFSWVWWDGRAQRPPMGSLRSTDRGIVVLGHAYAMPQLWRQGIRDWDEMESSPWPLQVDAALDALRWALLRRYSPERVVAFALTLPCETPDGARLLQELLRSFTYRIEAYMPPEGFGALRNLIRTRRHHPRLSSDLKILATIDPAMAEVLALELAAIADASVFGAHLVSPSLALAGTRLVSDESLPLGSRADVAYSIRQTIDARSAPPHPQGDAHAQLRTLEDFKTWFEQKRPSLEAAAAKDEPRLATARAAMETDVCRAPSQ